MKLYTSILLLGLFCSGWSQERWIQGKFIGENTNPVPEVLIQLADNFLSTYSDHKGFFRLAIPTSLQGSMDIKISHPRYETLEIPLSFSSSFLDLGEWRLRLKVVDIEEGLLVSDNDQTSFFNEDNQELQTNLQSRRTPFLSAVSFQFSPSFFSVRGLRRNHLPLRINGFLMNDLENDLAIWSQWGGLNDLFNRSQLVQHGLSPYGEYFGGLLGAVEINIRPSSFRKGIKLGQAFSNQSYQYRTMFTLNSGKLKDGWSISGLVSLRKGTQGYVEGTNYKGYSILAAIEKQWNGQQTSQFTLWYTPSERGRNAPMTKEVHALKGKRYNPNWGYDLGKARNARMVRTEVPHILANHTIDFSENLSFKLGAAFQFGEQGNSRILYTGQRPLGGAFIGGGSNPDPVYYQKLPSYFLRNPDQHNYRAAYFAQEELKLGGQIDWESLRSANSFLPDGASRYAIYEDLKKHKRGTFTIQFISEPSTRVRWSTDLLYSRQISSNYAQPIDFLGGSKLWDIDPFAEQGPAQLNNSLSVLPIVHLKKPFQYYYKINSRQWMTSTLWDKRADKGRLYVGIKWMHKQYQRIGIFENGGFPQQSLGKGDLLIFNTFSGKLGGTISLSAKQQLSLHLAYISQPPTLRSIYPNPRESHQFLPDLTPEKTFETEFNYQWQGNGLNLMLTAYIITQNDLNRVSFYFADGVGGDHALFIQEVLRDLSILNRGLEVGVKGYLTDELTIHSAVAIGNHQYANTPNLSLYTEPTIDAGFAGFVDGMTDYGLVNLKGYALGNGPQQAYSLGFQYNDPSYWRIGLTGNYFSNAYLRVNPLRRSSAFIQDPTGRILREIDANLYQQVIQQEKFPSYFTLNAIGSKSWKINQNYFGFFISIQNLLNKNYITGGFEQGRNANYTQTIEDLERPTPLFSPKYWWGRGTTFFSSIYYRF